MDEWLPQMVTLSTAEGLTLTRIAICDCARLQSRRVSAVKFSLGIPGAVCLRIWCGFGRGWGGVAKREYQVGGSGRSRATLSSCVGVLRGLRNKEQQPLGVARNGAGLSA